MPPTGTRPTVGSVLRYQHYPLGQSKDCLTQRRQGAKSFSIHTFAPSRLCVRYTARVASLRRANHMRRAALRRPCAGRRHDWQLPFAPTPLFSAVCRRVNKFQMPINSTEPSSIEGLRWERIANAARLSRQALDTRSLAARTGSRHFAPVPQCAIGRLKVERAPNSIGSVKSLLYPAA